MNRRLALTAAALAATAALGLAAGMYVLARSAPLSFTLQLAPEAARRIAALGLEVPVTGRAFVVLTRDTAREPREQVDVTGPPFWGKDVRGLVPGGTVTIADGDPAVLGYPLARLAELPPGDYLAQGFLNVYTTFRRADGHVLHLHQDAGEGQNLWRSPGNAYSRPVRLHIGARRGAVQLVLTEVIPPLEPVPPGGSLQQGNPRDSGLVRYVKIRSRRVSEFWGRDMDIGANVLLPRDYDARPDRRYPALYLQGHFPGRAAPFGFSGDEGRGRARGFRDFWLSPAAPPLVVVTIRDANPFYDTSYSVNSANVGPYGDAIVHELIPELERRFRLIPERWARALAGGSTGGWEALALQLFYPEVFGGVWAWCPDPVDFHAYQLVDLYGDENAYEHRTGWIRVERPARREVDGEVVYTIRQENAYERALGPRGESGGQWAVWEAVFGPVGDDGYPARIWDPVTGRVRRDVALYWRAHFDLAEYVRGRWREIGPLLAGRIHVTVGEADDYYLDGAVRRLEAVLDSLRDPPAGARFEYGPRQPHCWIGESRERPGTELTYAEFVRIAAEMIARRAPAARAAAVRPIRRWAAG